MNMNPRSTNSSQESLPLPGTPIEELSFFTNSSGTNSQNSSEENLPLFMASTQALQRRLNLEFELESYNPNRSPWTRSFRCMPPAPPSSPTLGYTSSSSGSSSGESLNDGVLEGSEPMPRGCSSISSPVPLGASKEAGEFVGSVIEEGKVAWKFYWFTPGKVGSFEAGADEKGKGGFNLKGECGKEMK